MRRSPTWTLLFLRERPRCRPEGVEGSLEITTELIYQNGELISSDVISSRVVSVPVDEVVLIGARQTLTESDTGEAQQPAQDDAAEAEPEAHAIRQACND